MSLRTEVAGAQSGDLLRRVVNDPAGAGGHGGIAGGKVTLGASATEAEWRAHERTLQDRLAVQLGLPASGEFRRVFV